MRISDWSSDVCSSDLRRADIQRAQVMGLEHEALAVAVVRDRRRGFQADELELGGGVRGPCPVHRGDPAVGAGQIGRAACRERVGQYDYISVGTATIQNKNKKNITHTLDKSDK